MLERRKKRMKKDNGGGRRSKVDADSGLHLRCYPLMENTTLAAEVVVPLALGPGPEFRWVLLALADLLRLQILIFPGA